AKFADGSTKPIYRKIYETSISLIIDGNFHFSTIITFNNITITDKEIILIDSNSVEWDTPFINTSFTTSVPATDMIRFLWGINNITMQYTIKTPSQAFDINFKKVRVTIEYYKN
ncbi:hypothetical protein, partial [Brachyspira intermedia]|uniref:hypothetical protein n=1 Tax=Brachyspira intermedia TaxID=84377 RepID=UPI0030062AD8